RSVLPRLARNLVTTDEIEREVRGSIGKRDHAAAEVGAKIGLDLIGVVLEAGIDLAAIVARRAPRGLLGFQHDRSYALLREMQRSREPREAAADNRDFDTFVHLQRRRRRRRCGRVGVEAWR